MNIIIRSIKPDLRCNVLLHSLPMEVIYMHTQIFSVTESGPTFPRACIVPNIWLRGHLKGRVAKVKTQISSDSIAS
jgi:hypothetical protein